MIWLDIFLITYVDTAAWNCKNVEFPRSICFNGYVFRIYIRLPSRNILARVFVYIKSTTSTLVKIIIKNIKCPHRTSQNIQKDIYIKRQRKTVYQQRISPFCLVVSLAFLMDNENLPVKGAVFLSKRFLKIGLCWSDFGLWKANSTKEK